MSVVVIVIKALVVIVAGAAVYKKAPPNVAMVVTGLGGSKTVSGKGCFVIPVLQRVDYLSLVNIQSD